MITGLDKDATVEYICEDDRGTDSPTIFVLGVMSYKDKLHFMGIYTNPERTIEQIAAANVELIDKCVKEVRNIKIKGTVTTINKNVADHLDVDVVREIVTEITKLNVVTKEEEKN
ncbi:MAG: hypothetical protein M0P69_04425 [Bacteroidales bacterium]|nr:hypothetical protein [Bacteroidales bacterium]